MPSPFPGMNPYLEQNDTWEDFHQSFLIHARDILNGQVGPNYLVKVEVRLYLHELSAEERRYFGRADAAITRPPGAPQGSAAASGLAGPMQLTLPAVDAERHSSLEIRDRRNRRLITTIELLSPTNKTPGPDRDEYLAKRAQILGFHTNLVEIDLRRGGTRPQPPELPECAYYILVSRSESWPHVDFWPVGLRDRLPVIPIPLAPPDPPVLFDLQDALHHVYDAAGYGKYIFAETPEPPLSPADEEWARQVISAHGGSQQVPAG